MKLLKMVNTGRIGMKVERVYQAGLILDRYGAFLNKEIVLNKFIDAAMNIQKISIEMQLPNILSLPFMLNRGALNLGLIGVETGLDLKNIYINELIRRKNEEELEKHANYIQEQIVLALQLEEIERQNRRMSIVQVRQNNEFTSLFDPDVDFM